MRDLQGGSTAPSAGLRCGGLYRLYGQGPVADREFFGGGDGHPVWASPGRKGRGGSDPTGAAEVSTLTANSHELAEGGGAKAVPQRGEESPDSPLDVQAETSFYLDSFSL